MPHWTQDEYRAFLSHKAGCVAPCAKPQQPVSTRPVGTPTREECNSTRFRVRIVSHRRKLIDPDNLCPKYFIDCLRYAEIIPDDRPEDIELAVSQKKCERGFERTEITIERMP